MTVGTTLPVVFDPVQESGGHQAAADTNLTGATWRTVFDGPDGIVGAASLSSGGGVLTCSGDVATLAPCMVKVNGFVLPVTAAEAMTLPAVASPTVYGIGVLADPSKDTKADQGGYLSLWYGVLSSLTVPAGGYYYPLKEVTRQPSTPMSSSTPVVDRAGFSGYVSTYQHTNPAALPADPLGSVAILGNGKSCLRVPDGSSSAKWVFQDRINTWAPATAGAAGWARTGGSNYGNYTERGGVSYYAIRLERTGGDFSTSSNGSLTDMDVLTIGVKPDYTVPIIGSLSIYNGGTYPAYLRVYPTGVVSLTSAAPSITITTHSVLWLHFDFPTPAS